MIEVMDKLMREVVGEMSKKVVKEVVGEIMDEEDENNNLVSTAAQAVRDESLLLSWRNLAPRGAYLHRIFILTELFCTTGLVGPVNLLKGMLNKIRQKKMQRAVAIADSNESPS